MELHLKIVGSLLIALSLMHVGIPRYFTWEQELTTVSLITKQILYVHTFFIALIVMLIGLLCVGYSHELVYDSLGRVISLGLFGFWLIRLIFQFVVYSPKVWRGKRFETIMHIVFAITWAYFAAVFFMAYITDFK
jgi:hypothetical protein